MVLPSFYIFEAILNFFGFLNGLFESQAHTEIKKKFKKNLKKRSLSFVFKSVYNKIKVLNLLMGECCCRLQKIFTYTTEISASAPKLIACQRCVSNPAKHLL